MADAWQSITPDAHGDWLRQRDDSFEQFIVAGDKSGQQPKLFENFSLGVVTNRDAWCWNPAKSSVTTNMGRLIDFYNAERERFGAAHGTLDKKRREAAVDGFIDTDATKIAWTRAVKQDLVRDKTATFDKHSLVAGLYRPFSRQWLYFNRRFNEMVYQMPRFFPDAAAENVVIGVSASESRSEWSVFISDRVASLHTTDMVGSQYFPLHVYEAADEDVRPSGAKPGQMALIAEAEHDLLELEPKRGHFERRDGITDEGLAHFRAAYPGEAIGKEDLFFYVYGLLHSPDYRERFADNLGKELPRIPCVKQAADFWAFSRAGRELARLHLEYETAPMYAAKVDTGGKPLGEADYRVEKMKFGKSGKDKDRSTVIYNENIKISGIPLEAYDYVVNGKPAIEWVMERQAVKTDKDSGIVNDANDWATETMGNARYPMELLLRVVTVSLETMKIVRTLPVLDI